MPVQVNSAALEPGDWVRYLPTGDLCRIRVLLHGAQAIIADADGTSRFVPVAQLEFASPPEKKRQMAKKPLDKRKRKAQR